MSRFKLFVIDSLGNKLIVPDLIQMFNLERSNLSRILNKHAPATLKELVDIRAECGKSRGANRIYVEGKYTIKEVGKKFNRSQSWALRAYTKHGCTTLKDFQIRANMYKKGRQRAKPKKLPDSIPMGTWERDNYRCPPANRKKSREVFKDIKNEEAGAIGGGRWSDAKKKVKRVASYAEMKEASQMMGSIPLLDQEFLR